MPRKKVRQLQITAIAYIMSISTKSSGIDKKKKKDRMVWDDVVQKWVPQFGYKKVQA